MVRSSDPTCLPVPPGVAPWAPANTDVQSVWGNDGPDSSNSPEQLQQQRNVHRSYQRHLRTAAAVKSSLLGVFSLQIRLAEYRSPGHTDSSPSTPSSVGRDFEDWEADLSPGAQYSLSGGHGPSPIPVGSPILVPVPPVPL